MLCIGVYFGEYEQNRMLGVLGERGEKAVLCFLFFNLPVISYERTLNSQIPTAFEE